MDHAQEIIDQITNNPHNANVGVLGNELLREFHRGYSIEYLRPLLLSNNDNVVEIGIWVASELGQKAKPLLDDVVTLLKHPAKAVRFFATDSVLSCATELNKSELASVIPLLDDAEAAVRWKTMSFLTQASREQLQGALDYLNIVKPESEYIYGLKWLLSEDIDNSKEVISFIKSANALLRKYGTVAAARTFQINSEPLFYAVSISDPDIKQFATDILNLRKISNK